MKRGHWFQDAKAPIVCGGARLDLVKVVTAA